MEPDKNIKRVVGEQSRRKVSAGLSMKSSTRTNVRFSKNTPHTNFSVSGGNKWVQQIGIQQVIPQEPKEELEFYVVLTPTKF